jgi:hypothetical protein
MVNDSPEVSFDRTQPIRMLFQITNKGATPAYNVAGAYWSDVLKYPLVDFDFSKLHYPESGTTSFPNSSDPNRILNFRSNVMPEEYQVKIREGGGYKYVSIGRVKYTDAFGRAHFTNFCWGYSISGDGGSRVDRCNKFNESD